MWNVKTKDHTWKARYQGATENSRIGHCERTAESANGKVQNVYGGK
jgi:hypothetical protein